MTPCREYQGPRDANGYGRRNGRATRRFGSALVHRQVWVMAHGETPPSTVVRHLCDNPPCFRLDHLTDGTQADNLADMHARGRARTNGYERKTHCPAGHPYDDVNTYVDRNGKRSCKTCAHNRTRARRAAARRAA